MKLVLRIKKKKIRIVPKVGRIREQTSTTFPIHRNKFQKGNVIMALLLTDSQEVDLGVEYLDKKGNTAKVDGDPRWASSDESKLVVSMVNGSEATIKAVGPLGAAQISVTADADLGDGVKEIIGVFDIEVVAGEAVSANVSANTPREQA